MATPTPTAIPLMDRIASIDTETEDLAITSPFENGSVRVRARYTRDRKKYTIKFAPLLVSEFNLLLNHYNTFKQYNVCIFDHPIDLIPYYVRFDKPLKYTIGAKGVNIVDVTITIVEI